MYYKAASHVDAAYCYSRSCVVLVCRSRSKAVQKRLNRSWCRSGCWLGWTQGTIVRWGPDARVNGEIFERKSEDHCEV